MLLHCRERQSSKKAGGFGFWPGALVDGLLAFPRHNKADWHCGNKTHQLNVPAKATRRTFQQSLLSCKMLK